jgi:cyclopropane-fatty-acyl-phospholipid synthase
MPAHTLHNLGRSQWPGVSPEQELYQSYSPEEDRRRTNLHYEQPAAFFHRLTGGEWNVYSCNLWNGAMTETQSQEAKLDLLAQLMALQPGQRILDVGCGWGGPLVYLSRKYGVEGVGLTLSSNQKQDAERRIARYGVNVQIVESHWLSYQDERGFDAIYTDEAIVHFHNLAEFFAKAHSMLRPGGRMVNKELHFSHSRHCRITRSTLPINELFGFTGNYRTLAAELDLLDQAHFEVGGIHHLPAEHYQKTLDRWLSNMHQHRAELSALVSVEYYLRVRKYLKLARMMISSHQFTNDVVVARRLDAAHCGPLLGNEYTTTPMAAGRRLAHGEIA